VRTEPEGPKLGKLERNALAELDLEASADGPKIRSRYTELVRRLHPDANGGDRAGENRLQKVIRAYQTLRKAGMV
jgi:DnaJ-class molecular chaperone